MRFTFTFLAVLCTVLFVGVTCNSLAIAHPYEGTSNTETSTTDTNRLSHDFVIPLYVNVLGKQPDPGGLFAWVTFLRGNCNADGFTQVASGFFDSRDFRLSRPRSVTGQVTVLNQTLLGRHPAPEGAAEWADV